MIQTSQSFVEAVSASSREWRARLMYDNNGTLTDTGATIKSIVVKGGSMTATALNLCGVYSSSLEAIVDSINFEWENKVITPQVGLVIGDTVEWVSLGKFTVTDPKVAKYVTTLIAVGNLSSKGGLSFTAPATPTIANIVSALQTQTGLTIALNNSFDTSLVINHSFQNLTALEVFAVLASVLGGFAYDRYDGVVAIEPYPRTTTWSVGTDRMTEEPTFADYDNTITGTHVIVSEASTAEDGTLIPAVEYGDLPYNITFSNPYMTAEAFTGFDANLTGLTWRKADVKLALGDPRLEATDLVAVTVDGTTYNVPCHNYVHKFDGGFQTEITSCGDSESFAEVQQTGQVTKRLKEITADIIRVDKAIAESIEIGGHFFVGSDGYIHITETENDYTTGNNILVDSDSVDIRQNETTVASFGQETRIGEQGKSGVAFTSTDTVFYDAQGSEAAYIGQGVTIVKEIVEEYIGGATIIATSQPLRVRCLLSNIAIIDSENSIAVGIIFASGSSRYNFTMTISSADTDFTATRGIFTFTVRYSSTLNRVSVIVSASSTVSNLSRISVTCKYNYTGLAPTYTFGLGLESTEPYSFIVGQYNEDNYNLFAVGNGADDNNRHNIFEIDLNGVTVNDGDFSVVNGTTSVGELWTDEIRASGIITAEQNIVFDSTNKGIIGVDYSDYAYPLICDNGTNLWIGASKTATQHHAGRTFISSGYDTSLGEGYGSIYVAVPNATNTGASTYRVYHEGNLNGNAPISVSNGVVSIANATTTASGAMSSTDKTKVDKLIYASGLSTANFGDSTNTDATYIWGNTSNKVGIGAYNNTDNKRYDLLARADHLALRNNTDGTIDWRLYPTSGAAPISVSNGVVSIADATTSASGAMSATDKTKIDKFAFATGITNVGFGDSSNTSSVIIYGNATNKINVATILATDNKRYDLSARSNFLRLYNRTDDSVMWDLYPPTSEAGAHNGGTDIANKSVPTGSYTTLGSFDVTAGVYLVVMFVQFTANATGRRQIFMTTTATGTSPTNVWNIDNQSAVDGAVTTCRIVTVLSASSATTWYVRAYQNSGSSLTATTRFDVTRL